MSSNKKISVLIADDEDHVRQLLKAVLSSLDCELVAEASNGREAVDAYMAQRPDVVLLDINMPVMTGLDALKAIRAASAEVIIIMFTSMADMGMVDDCIKQGASQYIRKDTAIVEMKKLLEKSWTPATKTNGDAS